jgi:hypothetical protein
MPAGSESEVIATELERVESTIPLLYEREDTFFSQVEKRPAEIVSSIAMRVPLELRPGIKTGQWNPDGGDAGRGDMPFYDKATVNTVDFIGRMEWTTRRKWATDSTRKATINTFKRDLANGIQEMRRAQDALCMTAGNGVLGTITTVATAGGVDTYTLVTDGFGARLLRFAQEIDIWDPTLVTKRTGHGAGNAGSYGITFYDGPNKTIQIVSPSIVAGDTAIQPGDLIVSQGITTAPPTSLLGVPYHSSSSSVGTWLGFNRATTPEIRSNSVNAAGPLALPMARLALNKLGDRLGMGKRGKKLQAWMHPAQKAMYEELGQMNIVINKDATDRQGLDLYFDDNMRIAGAPIKEDYNWDKTRIDFIMMDFFGRAEFHPLEWYKDDNGNRYFIVRGSSGGMAGSNLAYMVVSWQLYSSNPAAMTAITGLTVPSGY